MPARSLLRDADAEKSDRVGFIELFFDIVFVFAITQLAHRLIKHDSPSGVLESLVLFLAVWSVWTGTTWVTNRLDVERNLVRVMLLALMIGGILQSLAIPDAFQFSVDARAFAIVHVSMQLGRALFVALATRIHHEGYHGHFRRVFLWMLAAAPFWIIGSLGPDEDRLAWWGAALLFEYGAVAARYWVPVLGRSQPSDWDIEASHFAERCGLFVIIALGEVILITGNTIEDFTANLLTVTSLLTALISTMAMWWIYFSYSAERGMEELQKSRDPGRLARIVYIFFHIPLLFGLLVSAAGNEGLVTHPSDPTKIADVVRLIGGPWLFLLGALVIKRVICGGYVNSHVTGLVALAAIAPSAVGWSILAAGLTALSVLIAVAVWEELAIRTKRRAQGKNVSGLEASVNIAE